MNATINLNISNIKSSEVMTENVILYCGIAADEPPCFQMSLDKQEERLKAYCTAHDYHIIDIPEFQGCKEVHDGKSFKKRPVMSAILDYIRKNHQKVDKLLFCRWQHFSQDLESAISVLRELHKLGVEVNSIANGIDFNSPDWSILVAIYTMPNYSAIHRRKKRTDIHSSNI